MTAKIEGRLNAKGKIIFGEGAGAGGPCPLVPTYAGTVGPTYISPTGGKEIETWTLNGCDPIYTELATIDGAPYTLSLESSSNVDLSTLRLAVYDGDSAPIYTTGTFSTTEGIGNGNGNTYRFVISAIDSTFTGTVDIGIELVGAG